MPVIYGGEDAVAAFQDPELMAAYDKTPTLFAPDIYENILNMTAYTCFNKLFNDNGTVDGDALTRWLTGVKSAGEKGNVQVSYDQADMDRLKVNNTVYHTVSAGRVILILHQADVRQQPKSSIQSTAPCSRYQQRR